MSGLVRVVKKSLQNSAKMKIREKTLVNGGLS